MTASDHWFTRATIRRDAPDVAPLINILLGEAGDGSKLDTTHRLLWTLMPAEMQEAGKPASPSGADKAAFLWRRAPDADGSDVFYLLGPRPRDDSAFFAVETKPWAPVFAPGDRLAFDMIVNATVDRQLDPAKGRGGRKRIDIVADALRRTASAERGGLPRGVHKEKIARQAMTSWLDGQGQRNGFRLFGTPELIDQEIVLIGDRRKTAPKLGVARLAGFLDVMDPEVFARRVAMGFGRGKAFGYGLMLLKRAA